MSRLWIVWLVVGAGGLSAYGQGPKTARGLVFDDRNGNSVHDAGEPGLREVRVSNGRAVVRTNADGRYELPVDDDTTLFVIKPRDWASPVDNLNLPRFYYHHKPNGSPKLKYPGVEPTGPLPESIDFPLIRRPEPDTFKVVVFGDTQPRDIKEIEYLAHDVIEEVIGVEAAFGLSLGDLVFDRLELFQPLNEAVAQIGFVFYNILGNHDIDYTAPSDELSDETFERHYGPSYYSFDYGHAHFVVLDDVLWHPPNGDQKGHYTAGLGEKQMTFLRNDLALVPKEKLVILTMHIPILEIEERAEIYRLLAEFPHNVSFSAHWHVHRQWFLDKDDGWPAPTPHHHTTFVTTCGSWWSGAPDELGIPHTTMRDGAPNGWATVTFDGTDYRVEYQAARRPANYQMNIHTPEAVPAGQTAETDVLVNVFAGSERSTVEMRLDRGGEWVKLAPTQREDPYFAALKAAEEGDHPPPGRKLPRAEHAPHLWVAKLPADLSRGTHLIEVRTTDMFGQTYTGRRIFRVE